MDQLPPPITLKTNTILTDSMATGSSFQVIYTTYLVAGSHHMLHSQHGPNLTGESQIKGQTKSLQDPI